MSGERDLREQLANHRAVLLALAVAHSELAAVVIKLSPELPEEYVKNMSELSAKLLSMGDPEAARLLARVADQTLDTYDATRPPGPPDR